MLDTKAVIVKKWVIKRAGAGMTLTGVGPDRGSVVVIDKDGNNYKLAVSL